MEKVFKIIIKNPTFKYVIYDYPYYETALFENVTWNFMNINDSHTKMRQQLIIPQGIVGLTYTPTIRARITSFKDKEFINMEAIATRHLKLTSNFKILYKSKSVAHGLIKAKLEHKNYINMKVKAHGMQLAKVKNHDTYTLQNRDVFTLKDLEGTVVF